MKTNRFVSIFALSAILTTSALFAATNKGEEHPTGRFHGAKANTGMAIHYYVGDKSMIKVTPDFKVPDTPAPTWRVVDSKGTVYTLDAFKIKGGEKRQVMIPDYVRDIAKVQVYCAWAEVLLGEANFTKAVK